MGQIRTNDQEEAVDETNFNRPRINDVGIVYDCGVSILSRILFCTWYVLLVSDFISFFIRAFLPTWIIFGLRQTTFQWCQIS